jgi:hypothetical protein
MRREGRWSRTYVTSSRIGIFDHSKRRAYLIRCTAYQNDGAQIGVIVAHRSGGTDFALNRAGLDYLLKAKEEGRITGAFVVLARGPNGLSEFVAAEQAEKVKDNLSDVPPKVGNWGEYWWLAQNFKPPTLDAPFDSPANRPRRQGAGGLSKENLGREPGRPNIIMLLAVQ